MPTKLFSSSVTLMATALLCSALPAQGQVQLPEGQGKETVQAVCTRCHTLDRVVSAELSQKEWESMVAIMVNAGAPLPKDQFSVVVDYLSKNFHDNTKPAAVGVPGSVEATIQEWPVPTPGSLPHDPLFAPDGSVWYAGQMADLLGKFNPKTGEFKEYHLKTPHSGAHGITADKDGNIWFTANFAGYIGKLDPKTGDITEYPMPDPAASDPHTLVFDHNGILWFTVQNAGMVGRLVPTTGEVKLVTVPTQKARPYGMVVDSKGIPYFVEFGANKIASIDPETMAIREYNLPNANARPRRIAITSDDVLWYGDFARGYLGRFDPKTGKTNEWPSPSGPKSQPYGLTALNDAVWYSESGTKPNTVVRFDLKTEKFQTWRIPSGGGVVRNMVHTPEGNLWLACSGVDNIALVAVKNSGKSMGATKGSQ
jgi:virginiamycin B lyase